MLGQFVLLVKRDVLVPEEHDTSLLDRQQLQYRNGLPQIRPRPPAMRAHLFGHRSIG